jgi:hypothetical protein
MVMNADHLTATLAEEAVSCRLIVETSALVQGCTIYYQAVVHPGYSRGASRWLFESWAPPGTSLKDSDVKYGRPSLRQGVVVSPSSN